MCSLSTLSKYQPQNGPNNNIRMENKRVCNQTSLQYTDLLQYNFNCIVFLLINFMSLLPIYLINTQKYENFEPYGLRC